MQTVTEILIDFSTSMKEKLTLAKSAIINDVVPSLNYSAKIGIKTFTATNNKIPIIKSILPLSITNKEQILHAITSLKDPEGNTPIAEVLKNSVRSLKEYLAFDKKIILITDGEENCGGNYIEEVKKAREDGINCKIHIIGIGLKKEAISKAQAIATLSEGSFSAIPFYSGAMYNQTVVRQNLKKFYDANNELLMPPITKDVLPKPNILQPEEKKVAKDNQNIISINEQISLIDSSKNDILEVHEDPILNERIRVVSENYLYELLKKKYPNRVKWLNQFGESNCDHDFEILDLDGNVEYYIECKGTSKRHQTFYLTKSEWRLFLNHTKNYQVYFIQNSFATISYIFVDNLLDWLLKGRLVPYLNEKMVIKEDRVFLTVLE